MAALALVNDARRAWHEYGQAIVRAFDFPPNSRIAADDVEGPLAEASDDQIQRFIVYVRQQTATVATAD